MTQPRPEPDVVLTLRPLKDPDNISYIIRLRNLLKTALRHDFFRDLGVTFVDRERSDHDEPQHD